MQKRTFAHTLLVLSGSLSIASAFAQPSFGYNREDAPTFDITLDQFFVEYNISW